MYVTSQYKMESFCCVTEIGKPFQLYCKEISFDILKKVFHLFWI